MSRYETRVYLAMVLLLTISSYLMRLIFWRFLLYFYRRMLMIMLERSLLLS